MQQLTTKEHIGWIVYIDNVRWYNKFRIVLSFHDHMMASALVNLEYVGFILQIKRDDLPRRRWEVTDGRDEKKFLAVEVFTFRGSVSDDHIGFHYGQQWIVLYIRRRCCWDG